MASAKTAMKKVGKIFLYLLLGVLILLFLAILFLNTGAGKELVRKQVVSYLQDKLQTELRIGKIDYGLPQWIEIKDIYLADRQKDSLLYAEKIRVDLNLFKLIRGNTDIQKVDLENVSVQFNRQPTDSVFNFEFIVDAFTGNKLETANPDTSELKISLDKLLLKKLRFVMDDRKEGSLMSASVDFLESNLEKFQPDRLHFAIDDLNAKGLHVNMITNKPEVADTLVRIIPDSLKQESTYGLYVTANRFFVEDAFVNIDNTISGMLYKNDLQTLKLTDALFSLEQNIVLADSLLLQNGYVQFRSPLIEQADNVIIEAPEDTASQPWYISAGQFNVDRLAFVYDDMNKDSVEGFDPAHIGMNDIQAHISSFLFSSDTSRANIAQLRFQDKSGFRLDSTHAQILFTDKLLSATALHVQTGNSVIRDQVILSYDSVAGITTHPQNSLLQLRLQSTRIAFNDLYLLMPTLKNSFPEADFANRELLLSTELRGNLQHVYIPFLQLKGLDGTSLFASGNLYNLTDADRFRYDLQIRNGQILKQDILKFLPAENRETLKELPRLIRLDGRIAGNTNSLQANLSTGGPGFFFDGRLDLNNIQSPDQLVYAVDAKKLTVDRNTLLGFIPPDALPENITLPAQIQGYGKFKGTANGFESDLRIESEYGRLGIAGYLHNYSTPEMARYDLALRTEEFMLGKLLGNDSTFGSVTARLNAKGKGFDYTTMTNTVSADIAALEYNGYRYRNGHVQAEFNNGTAQTLIQVNDSNLVLQSDLSAHFAQAYPSLVGYIDVDTIQLHALNLSSDTVNLSLHTAIDAQSTQPGALDFKTLVDSIHLVYGKQVVKMDSISLVGTHENEEDDIRLQSDFASMHARGAFEYDKIGASIIDYINGYYYTGIETADSTLSEQQMVFDATVSDHPLLHVFVPDLLAFDGLTVEGSYRSADTDSALRVEAHLPYAQYQNHVVRQGRVEINSRNEKINYALQVDSVETNNMAFYGTRLSGAAAKDSISIHAVTQDEKAKDWFAIHADFFQVDSQYHFRLKDSLRLNYELWSVEPNNLIRTGSKGLWIENFSLHSDTASITAQSQNAVANSPVDIHIDNFNLKSISSLISGDTLFASGILDADVLITNLNGALPAYTGTASITDLQLKEQSIGDIHAQSERVSERQIAASLTLTGNNNDVQADANYYLENPKKEFDLNLQLNHLNAATLQGFSGGQLKNASGKISGQVQVQGKFDNPSWNGNIRFDSTRITATEFAAPFVMDNQQIVLEYPYVRFQSFTIEDSLQNKLVLDGNIRSRSMTDYVFDLDINADDFIVMNAKQSVDNDLFGFAQVDADLQITGTSEAPDLQGLVKLNEKTNVTLVLPETNYEKDQGLSVVKFIDTDTFDVYDPPVRFTETPREKLAFGKYLNYNFTIELERDATFRVIIDPSTGDELEVQGYALLNAGVDPGGNLVLSGNYDLDKGHYNFSYQFLNRRFDLKDGSSISFAGAPMDAQIDITAAYIVNTDSQGLLGNEVTGGSSISNLLNQKLPYELQMKLTGVLSKPNIKFSVQLQEGDVNINSDLKTAIDNKLNQLNADETAMNRQAFSLLLFNRFVSEQSSDFFRGNGTNFSDLARQSVSQFLSSAIDNIADDLIKGVDIDLALNSYEEFNTEGGSRHKTDLKLALSKKFLNDRLTITVGKNFGLEGQDAASKSNTARTSAYYPDFSAAYQLSKDGRYLIKGYRKNAYEAVLDGFVIESGVSFVVTLDYDKFIELFRKKKKVETTDP